LQANNFALKEPLLLQNKRYTTATDGGSAENAGAIFCQFILNIKKGKNPKALPLFIAFAKALASLRLLDD
tara:strand:+ start:460 stop:669 length:210 start_codon:yes stop_codon:yes gene_type:complete